MAPQNEEQERLARLRERQLSARDPQEKQRTFHHSAAERERKRDTSLNFSKMWSVIPHIWRWFLYGLILGLLAIVIVPLFWKSDLTTPCIGIGTLVAIGIGMMIGQGLDTRDALKKLTK